MEPNDRVNQPAPEQVRRQPLPGARERNGEAGTSEPAPEATAPPFRDYCVLTGRSAPWLPCVRPSAESAQRDYSVLTGRTEESSPLVVSIRARASFGSGRHGLAAQTHVRLRRANSASSAWFSCSSGPYTR